MILASVLVRLIENHCDAHAGQHSQADQWFDSAAPTAWASEREQAGERSSESAEARRRL